MKENENTTTQNQWDTVKAVLRGRWKGWGKFRSETPIGDGEGKHSQHTGQLYF